jgi:hypothetical protein
VFIGIIAVCWTLYATIGLLISPRTEPFPWKAHLFSVLLDVAFLVLAIQDGEGLLLGIGSAIWLIAILYSIYDSRSEFISLIKTATFLIFHVNAKNHPNYELMKAGVSFMTGSTAIIALQIMMIILRLGR